MFLLQIVAQFTDREDPPNDPGTDPDPDRVFYDVSRERRWHVTCLSSIPFDHHGGHDLGTSGLVCVDRRSALGFASTGTMTLSLV
jgi:hypothetical protein